jgi:hypothetical protein
MSDTSASKVSNDVCLIACTCERSIWPEGVEAANEGWKGWAVSRLGSMVGIFVWHMHLAFITQILYDGMPFLKVEGPRF